MSRISAGIYSPERSREVVERLQQAADKEDRVIEIDRNVLAGERLVSEEKLESPDDVANWLASFGFDRDICEFYADSVRAGQNLVVFQADREDEHFERAAADMRAAEPPDVQRMLERWQAGERDVFPKDVVGIPPAEGIEERGVPVEASEPSASTEAAEPMRETDAPVPPPGAVEEQGVPIQAATDVERPADAGPSVTRAGAAEPGIEGTTMEVGERRSAIASGDFGGGEGTAAPGTLGTSEAPEMQTTEPPAGAAGTTDASVGQPPSEMDADTAGTTDASVGQPPSELEADTAGMTDASVGQSPSEMEADTAGMTDASVGQPPSEMEADTAGAEDTQAGVGGATEQQGELGAAPDADAGPGGAPEEQGVLGAAPVTLSEVGGPSETEASAGGAPETRGEFGGAAEGQPGIEGTSETLPADASRTGGAFETEPSTESQVETADTGEAQGGLGGAASTQAAPGAVTGMESEADSDVGAEEETIVDESTFRSHFDQQYANGTASFDDYRDAYAFGYGYGRQPRLRDMEFEAAEPTLIERYEQRHGAGSYERVREAVRHGWDLGRR